jgi:predicted DNA-binding protein
MASFIYFYSKFTEEFLLLSAAGIFTLLSIYCYTWVVKKRRLGAARNQVPAGMVKVYLNQLINEAQFVRTQLFGLVGGIPPDADNFAAHFQASSAHPSTSVPQAHAPTPQNAGTEISPDLAERLKALQNQLAEKESMVVNINVEKSKLLEEVENFRQNEKAMSQAATGNNDDLAHKIKALEERLEEYALFEDDLANLKRLQQENALLKKQLEGSPTPQVALNSAAPIPQVAPIVTAAPEAKPSDPMSANEKPLIPVEKNLLDQYAIEALLDGTPATPPTATATEKAAEEDTAAALAAATAASLQTVEAPVPINAAAALANGVKAAQAYVEAQATELAPAQDALAAETAPLVRNTGVSKTPEENFEKLVDSVEDSLTAAPYVPVVASAPPAVNPIEKSDEELLKEFENLLNS